MSGTTKHMDYTKRELPTGWRWVRLGEYTTKVGSGITPLGGQTSYLRSGVPLIRSQNVHLNTFQREGLAYISEEQDAMMSNSRVQPGDVLINITGASIGRVCVVPKEVCPANVNQHVCIVRCTGEINPEFLSYYISTPPFQRFILNTQAGATRQALTKALIENFRIPLPPVDEQRRIAGVVREQMAAVDKARVAAQARLDAVKTLPASLLRQAFPQPGQPLPAGWRWVRLGDKATLLPSRSIASDGDSQVQAVTTACLTESGFNPGGVKSARMRVRDVQDCLIAPGEVLIARSNTPELVGRACLFDGIPEKIVASDLTIRVQANSGLLPDFLSRYLSVLFIRGYWRDQAGGASGSMKKITRTQVVDLAVPLPSLSEQERIAGVLREQMGSVEKARAGAEEELAAINALPAALLRRAFNGEI